MQNVCVCFLYGLYVVFRVKWEIHTFLGGKYTVILSCWEVRWVIQTALFIKWLHSTGWTNCYPRFLGQADCYWFFIHTYPVDKQVQQAVDNITIISIFFPSLIINKWKMEEKFRKRRPPQLLHYCSADLLHCVNEPRTWSGCWDYFYAPY